MKTDTCLLCGGTRYIGWLTALCEDCQVVQRTPEGQRLHEAWSEFVAAVRKAFRLR